MGFSNIDYSQDILESIYAKVEKFGLGIVSKKTFGFVEISSLVLFTEAAVSEIRDDLKERVTVELIKRFYASDAFAEFKGKIPEEIRKKVDGFIDEGLSHYVVIINSLGGKFNYYLWKRWIGKKIRYYYKYFTGFFSGEVKPEVVLCAKCKMPIDNEIIKFIETPVIVVEDTTPVVSQMEVFPGQAVESVQVPWPSALAPVTIASSESRPPAKVSVPVTTQEKM